MGIEPFMHLSQTRSVSMTAFKLAGMYFGVG